MKSVIFMQASVKMNAVLNCYEAEKAKGRKVTIVLPYVLRNTQQFIRQLKLDAHLVTLDRMTGKAMIVYPFIYKKIIKRNIKRIGVSNTTHFFFTDVNDIDIGLLLPYLKECEPTQILTSIDINDGENYQIERHSSNRFQKIKSRLLSFFYNTHFIAVLDSGTEFIYTDNIKFKFPRLDYSDTSIINKYRITVTDTLNCVIFYTSPYFEKIYYKDDYEKLNKDIIDILHIKGYRIYVKSHPRFGDPEVLKGLADVILPSYIPGEFINLSTFNFAIGIFSTVLGTASEIIPSYSVLNIGRVKNENIRDSAIKYISDINPSVHFISSLEEIPVFKPEA